MNTIHSDFLSIKRATEADIGVLVDIWYEASILSHNFIPESYWQENKKIMQDHYLPLSESYLIHDENSIHGFISLVDHNHIAALFIRPNMQGMGLGSMLLAHAQKNRTELSLKVYSKNAQGVHFYQAKGFKLISESVDEATAQTEFLMQFKADDE